MKGVTVLGSTGSIGASTLDVLARHRDRFRLVALSARSDVENLFRQCVEHRPRYAVLVEEAAARQLSARLVESGVHTEVLAGKDALLEIVTLAECQVVMAAIVGAAGLAPNLAAVRAGKRVLLANKESLVMAGALFMGALRESRAELIPVDSEHNALFQCMPADYRVGEHVPGVRRLLLTASGGPFRQLPIAQLAEVTPEQACAHPNWVMGRKISVDSASMMNKGLEVIEACWLFNMPAEKVDVVIHPQSVVHSLVEYQDGSVLAQLGNPDMRTPIACGLNWPERMNAGVDSLDLVRAGPLEFEVPDEKRFPCYALAHQAARIGDSAPALLNAANEVAVEAFLNRRLPFTGIAQTVAHVLEKHPVTAPRTLAEVIEVDAAARHSASAYIEMLAGAA